MAQRAARRQGVAEDGEAGTRADSAAARFSVVVTLASRSRAVVSHGEHGGSASTSGAGRREGRVGERLVQCS